MRTKKANLLLPGIALTILTGTLDAMAAVMLNPTIAPIRIFLYIASGFFGKDALKGGTQMMIYGMLFHYAFAALFTFAFLAVYNWMRLIDLNKFMTAIVYGGLIWMVMNLIVLPNSHAMRFPLEMDSLIIGVCTLIGTFGLPLAFITPWYIKRKTRLQ